MRVRNAYQHWCKAASNEEFLEGSNLKSLAGLVVFAACIVGGLTAFESTRRWFDLPPLQLAFALLPVIVTTVAQVWARGDATQLTPRVAAFHLLTAATVQFFAASLMALSRYPAAAVFSSFVLLTAATHGRTARVTPRQPFVTVGLLVAMGAAYLLARSQEHGLLFAVTTPAAVVAQWLTGSFAVAQDRSRREEERMRAALQAQVWREQELQVGQSRQALGQVLQNSSELGRALTEVSAALDLLAGLRSPSTVLVNQHLEKVRERLQRMDALVQSISSTSRSVSAPVPEEVALLPVLEGLRSQMELLHPGTRLEVQAQSDAGNRVRVSGGVISLRRILENLLLNACEGNGQRGASRIRVLVERDMTGGRLCLIIEDDGPGFTPEQLEGPRQPLRSTKPGAQGLGLYTVEALVHCSGGRFECGNHPDGGARVRVLLPRADALSGDPLRVA